MTVRALAADAVAAAAPNGMASVANNKREEKRGSGKPLERLKKLGFVWPSINYKLLNPRATTARSRRAAARRS
jgi:hypothetical protein